MFIFFAREAGLVVGGNRGIQKCDSVDPLSLVIKCLEEGGHKSRDYFVLTFNTRPFHPGDQVNTDTC